MADDDRFINPTERSLLTALIGLYSCDLSVEPPHGQCHVRCIACAKQAIIVAITRYCELDAEARVQAPRGAAAISSFDRVFAPIVNLASSYFA